MIKRVELKQSKEKADCTSPSFTLSNIVLGELLSSNNSAAEIIVITYFVMTSLILYVIEFISLSIYPIFGLFIRSSITHQLKKQNNQNRNKTFS